MIDPTVSIRSSHDYLASVNKIVHTIRKTFEYKRGPDIVTVETYVVQLYDKKGNLMEHNPPPKIDKLA